MAPGGVSNSTLGLGFDRRTPAGRPPKGSDRSCVLVRRWASLGLDSPFRSLVVCLTSVPNLLPCSIGMTQLTEARVYAVVTGIKRRLL